MHNFDLRPKDVIAALSIVGFILLKFTGMNGEVDIAIALILGYYFGHRTSQVDSGQ